MFLSILHDTKSSLIILCAAGRAVYRTVISRTVPRLVHTGKTQPGQCMYVVGVNGDAEVAAATTSLFTGTASCPSHAIMPSFVTQRSLSRAQHKCHRSRQQRGGSAHEEGQRARRNAATAGDRGGVKSGGEERREDAACTLRRLQQCEVAPASLRRRVLRGESGAGRVGDGVADPRQKEDQSVHRLRLDEACGGKADAEEHLVKG